MNNIIKETVYIYSLLPEICKILVNACKNELDYTLETFNSYYTEELCIRQNPFVDYRCFGNKIVIYLHNKTILENIKKELQFIMDDKLLQNSGISIQIVEYFYDRK